MMRRTLLQSILGATAGGLPRRRPDQHIPVGWPGMLPAPTTVVIGRTVLVFGPTGSPVGVFIYTPGTTPGAGNPPTDWMSEATADPYGNVLASPGTGTQSSGEATVLAAGSVSSYTGPVSGLGPWTQRFVMVTTNGLTSLEGIGLGQAIKLLPGANSPLQLSAEQTQVLGGLSAGNGQATQTLINGSTINTAQITVQPVTAAAAVTGIILQPGTTDGQIIMLPSDATSPNTITFAAAATSNVRTGTGAVITPGDCMILVWVAARSLWWQVQ